MTPSNIHADWVSLHQHLLGCSSFAQLQPALLDPAARALRSSSAALIQAGGEIPGNGPASGHFVKRSLHVGPLGEAMRSYAERDFCLDPIFGLAKQRVHRFSLASARQGGDERFREFLIRHGITETFGLTIPVSTAFGTEVFALSFQRRGAASEFQPRDCALVQQLLPALTLTLRSVVQAEMLDALAGTRPLCPERSRDAGAASLSYRSADPPGPTPFRLTPREREVSHLIAAGMDNATAAHHLGISVRTVENHLRAVYAKMGVRRRTQMLGRLLRLH